MNLSLIPTVELWKLRAEQPYSEALRAEERERLKFFAYLRTGIAPQDQNEDENSRMQQALDRGAPYWPNSLFLTQEDEEALEKAERVAEEESERARECEEALRKIDYCDTLEEAKDIARSII